MTTYAPAPPRAMPRRAPIDPRVRARRVAVTREAGRRRLRRLLWALGALGFAAVAAGAVVSPLLDLNQIAVTGVGGAHADEVRAAAGVDAGAALLLLDTGAVTARVEALPWVDEVNVARQLPGTLRVEVTPRFPVAWRTTETGEIEVLDSRGTVISTAAAPDPALPELLAGSGRVGAAARVAGALSSPLRPQVVSIWVNDGNAVVTLHAGPELRFGAISDLGAKVRASEAMLAELAGTPVRYIDVTVPSAPVTG